MGEDAWGVTVGGDASNFSFFKRCLLARANVLQNLSTHLVDNLSTGLSRQPLET